MRNSPSTILAISTFLALLAYPAFADDVTCQSMDSATRSDPQLDTLAMIKDKLSHQASYDFKFALTNDNWGMPGDDFGYTHGAMIGLQKNNANGTHLGVDYSTDLYTKFLGVASIDAEGREKYNQYAVNNDMLKVTYDNEGQKTGLYYSVAGGMHYMTSDPCQNNFLQASCEQIWFHHATSVNYNFIDHPDGNPTRLGAMGQALVGVQGEQKAGPVLLSARVDAGGVLDMIPGASQAIAQAEASAEVHPGMVGVKVSAGVDMMNNGHGTEIDPHAKIAMDISCFEAGAEFREYDGKLINYEHYNLDDINTDKPDPTIQFYIQQGFGGGKNANCRS